MPRKRREISVNGLYHVIARGNSQQIRADMYRWSSYGDYYDKDPRTCIDKIKERFPEEKLFEEFISNKTDKGVQYFENAQLHLNDEELQRMIKELTGADSGFEIASFPRKERNNAVRLLRSAGMTIKTVVRLTGIGYGIVAKCRPNK